MVVAVKKLFFNQDEHTPVEIAVEEEQIVRAEFRREIVLMRYDFYIKKHCLSLMSLTSLL